MTFVQVEDVGNKQCNAQVSFIVDKQGSHIKFQLLVVVVVLTCWAEILTLSSVYNDAFLSELEKLNFQVVMDHSNNVCKHNLK